MKSKPVSALKVASYIMILFILTACEKDEDLKVEFFLPSNKITKIITDADGTKWIATAKGIVCFDGQKWNPYPEIPVTVTTYITDLYFVPGDPNEILMSTVSGVQFVKFNKNKILMSGGINARENGLLSNDVYSMAVDNLNARYFGTSMGLSIYKNDTWDYFYGRETEQILKEYRISSVATAKNGWNYAATLGGGVSRFKYTDAVTGATTYDSIWAGLESNFVNTVVIVDDTCQWYGTNHGAAFHTSHHTKNDWIQLTVSDGLISDTVLSIAKDLNGNIWFGTSNGLSRLNGDQFTSYTSTDGIINNRINTISIDTDGSVWFGTDGGLSHFKDNSWINYKFE